MGIQVMSSAFDELIFWGAGLFEETDDGAPNFNDFKDYNITARVTGRPLKADDRRTLNLGRFICLETPGKKSPRHTWMRLWTS